MTVPIILQVRKELKQNIDPGTVATGQKFFKEQIKFYGVKSVIVGKIAKKYFSQLKDKPKKEVFSLCEELFKSDYNEEAWIACDWAYAVRRQYQPADFKIFAFWIKRYINNWAKCDTLCNHVVGDFIEQYPQFIEALKTWTGLKNRWMRRAAAVTLILPSRKGKFLKDVFDIADRLLVDKDDLVQKGYGWMLKEASKVNEQEVFDYIMKHKKEMPRTALRYAIEKMPKELRMKAMEK